MAKYLLRCDEASSNQEVAEILAEYKAHESYDLWSFGTVLFHLGSGCSLWHCKSHSGSIANIDDMEKLAEWDDKTRHNELKRLRGNLPEQMALYDLVHKLLEPCPEDRIKHFPQAMISVLEHPFLKGTALDVDWDSASELSSEAECNSHFPQIAEAREVDGGSWLHHLLRFSTNWRCGPA